MRLLFGLICRRLVRAVKCAATFVTLTDKESCGNSEKPTAKNEQCQTPIGYLCGHRIAVSASIIARSVRIQTLKLAMVGD